MIINDFEGETYVAYLDISGFKELMKVDKKAWFALDKLYQFGYHFLKKYKDIIASIFISDCGILFIQENHPNIERLKLLLEVIRDINKKMLERDFMLTTSIGFGKFKYQERIEFKGINKNPIYGDAYISSYFDNEKGKPKIEPGQCRMIIKNLPEEIINFLDHPNTNIQSMNNVLHLISKRKNDNTHYYFYWMRDNRIEINNFEKRYRNSYNLKYDGFLNALKG